MAYQFAGFFASPVIPQPARLPNRAVWREVRTPFVGVGVGLPDLIGKSPTPVEIEALALQLGLDEADRWVYLSYDCWGGRIDFIFGLGMRAGIPFGPVEEDALDRVEAAYTSLMEQFGVSTEDALNFDPFARGYWGEG